MFTNPFVIATLGLCGVAITGLLTYAGVRRKMSGTIKTTEAETLWEQTNELLNRYKNDLVEARAEVAALRVEISALRSELENTRNLLREEHR